MTSDHAVLVILATKRGRIASTDGKLPKHVTCPYLIQESRAVARKARDATYVLFGLKFGDNIHYNFKSSQASKARLQSSKIYRRKIEFNAKWPLKVIQGRVFWSQWKGGQGLSNTNEPQSRLRLDPNWYSLFHCPIKRGRWTHQQLQSIAVLTCTSTCTDR